MGRRKGRLEEVISRALYADDSELYVVAYRDMGVVKELRLVDFLAESEYFSKIPASRIVEVRREGKVVYRSASALGKGCDGCHP